MAKILDIPKMGIFGKMWKMGILQKSPSQWKKVIFWFLGKMGKSGKV